MKRTNSSRKKIINIIKNLTCIAKVLKISQIQSFVIKCDNEQQFSILKNGSHQIH